MMGIKGARNAGTKRFTVTHEWVSVTGNEGTVGITDHAQSALGDVVFVGLPEVGADIKAGEHVCDVESVKAVGDIMSPVSGKITAVNSALTDTPQLINTSPEDQGWIFRVSLSASHKTELSALLDAAAYSATLDH